MLSILEGLDGVICHGWHPDTQWDLGRTQQAGQRSFETSARCWTNSQWQMWVLKETDPLSWTSGWWFVNTRGHTQDFRITDFPAPTNITELQRFMSMVNQLGKFIPDLANYTEPMRQLLRSDTEWYWGESQQKSFQTVNDLLISPKVLAPMILTVQP